MAEQDKFVLRGTRQPGRLRPGNRARLAPARQFANVEAVQPLPRRHAAGLDPVLTRKSHTSHKGVLVLVAAFVVFVAYVNNVGGLQLFADSLLDNLNQNAHAQNGAVVSLIVSVFPYLIGLLLLLVVLSVFRGLVGKSKAMRKERRLNKRDEVGMEQFIDESVAHGISAKVAREAYRLLQGICSDCMRARFSDELKYDLHLQNSDVVNLYAALIKKTDRRLRAEDIVAPYKTVIDVMRAVERSPALRTDAVQPQRARPGEHLQSFVRPAVRPAERTHLQPPPPLSQP